MITSQHYILLRSHHSPALASRSLATLRDTGTPSLVLPSLVVSSSLDSNTPARIRSPGSRNAPNERSPSNRTRTFWRDVSSHLDFGAFSLSLWSRRSRARCLALSCCSRRSRSDVAGSSVVETFLSETRQSLSPASRRSCFRRVLRAVGGAREVEDLVGVKQQTQRLRIQERLRNRGEFLSVAMIW